MKRITAVASAVGAVTFQDTNGNAITGSMALAAGSPLVNSTPADSADFDGVMNVAAGAGLNMVVTGAVNIGGLIQYTQ